MKISGIILGKNQNASFNKRCLASLSFCDETIVVPTENVSGSFAQWRNHGAKMAKFDWLLYVDSDEEVTSALSEEIINVVDESKFSAYAIPRRNIIFGKEFKYGGQWPDYVIRLIKKDKLVSWLGDLHEQPKIEGDLGYLKNPLIHTKHSTLSEMVDKTNTWSDIEAKLMFDAHHPPMNFFRFASAGLREFWLRMIVQTSFLDGTEGVIYALYQVYSRLISYSKLWELQLNNASSNL